MPAIEIKFSVTPDNKVNAYWIAVGETDIPLVNGKGSIFLELGQQYLLVWWFTGNSGGSISIKGESVNSTVVEVKSSTIPNADHQGAGVKRFQL